jgi:hypothetical protein
MVVVQASLWWKETSRAEEVGVRGSGRGPCSWVPLLEKWKWKAAAAALDVGLVLVVVMAMESMAKRRVCVRGMRGWVFILSIDGLQRGWVLVFVVGLVLGLGLGLGKGRGKNRELAFRNAPVGRGRESTRKKLMEGKRRFGKDHGGSGGSGGNKMSGREKNRK